MDYLKEGPSFEMAMVTVLVALYEKAGLRTPTDLPSRLERWFDHRGVLAKILTLGINCGLIEQAVGGKNEVPWYRITEEGCKRLEKAAKGLWASACKAHQSEI